MHISLFTIYLPCKNYQEFIHFSICYMTRLLQPFTFNNPDYFR